LVLHIEFTLGQCQEWWLAGHERAFAEFGAVPAKVPVELQNRSRKVDVTLAWVGGDPDFRMIL